jgi:acylphosphatase
MDHAARHVWIRGRVQGVGFRWSTRARARDLHLVGWVRNLPDGSVEAWLEGKPDDVESMLTWLEDGSAPGRVDSVEVVEGEASGAGPFEVRR